MVSHAVVRRVFVATTSGLCVPKVGIIPER